MRPCGNITMLHLQTKHIFFFSVAPNPFIYLAATLYQMAVFEPIMPIAKQLSQKRHLNLNQRSSPPTASKAVFLSNFDGFLTVNGELKILQKR